MIALSLSLAWDVLEYYLISVHLVPPLTTYIHGWHDEDPIILFAPYS